MYMFKQIRATLISFLYGMCGFFKNNDSLNHQYFFIKCLKSETCSKLHWKIYWSSSCFQIVFYLSLTLNSKRSCYLIIHLTESFFVLKEILINNGGVNAYKNVSIKKLLTSYAIQFRNMLV